MTYSKTAHITWEKRAEILNFHRMVKLKKIHICFLTFNISEHKPPSDLHLLVQQIPDIDKIQILFVSLQEIDFSTKSIITGNSEESVPWTRALRRAFLVCGKSLSFICEHSFGGLYLTTFIQSDLDLHFSVDEPRVLRFGAGGLMANKGAIILPVRIGECSISVIASHLPSGASECERRVECLKLIFNDLKTDYAFLFGDLNLDL